MYISLKEVWLSKITIPLLIYKENLIKHSQTLGNSCFNIKNHIIFTNSIRDDLLTKEYFIKKKFRKID